MIKESYFSLKILLFSVYRKKYCCEIPFFEESGVPQHIYFVIDALLMRI